jgi:hypothetical protein
MLIAKPSHDILEQIYLDEIENDEQLNFGENIDRSNDIVDGKDVAANFYANDIGEE